MLKSIKIFSILLIIFSIFISFYSVYASNIDMNLVDNQLSENANQVANDNATIPDDETQNTEDLDTITPPTSVGAVAEEGLSFSNILSILLITVGVILILLAIAIIIRLK